MATNLSCTAGTLALRDPIKVLNSKWDMIFDVKEWIAFKPALGIYVYPCYSCQQMFSCKKSFLDHINRRAVLLKFTCSDCNDELLTFYNRCSFLLHCRKHYNMHKGQLNLKNLEISTLPFGLAGFFKVSEIPYLFDLEEDLIPDGVFMNSQFYTPNPEDKGKEIINLCPTNLVIDRKSPNGEVQSLALKQIAKNIPKCQFITLEAYKEIQANMEALSQAPVSEVKNELHDEITFRSWVTESPPRPIENGVSTNSYSPESSDQVILSDQSGDITQTDPEEETNPLLLVKVETVIDEENTRTETTSDGEEVNNQNGHNSSPDKCSECKIQVHESLQSHFLGDNKPSEVILRCLTCKLISPTLCSFQAHERIHLFQDPYVCPDCGIEYASSEELFEHMDNVCFHTSKSVRIKCPGRRCGKVFASEATFGLHFKQVHLESYFVCVTCQQAFTNLQDCEEHCQSHPEQERSFEKFFSCLGCSEEAMTSSQLKKHIDLHCSNLCRFIYTYMCKFCKCYFRSVQTMGIHLSKCKVQKFGLPVRARSVNNTYSGSKFTTSKYMSGQCVNCSTKIIFLKSKPTDYCKKCPSKPDKNSTSVPNEWFCPLCKCYIGVDKKEQHKVECKFSTPRIVLEKLDMEKLLEQNQKTNLSNGSDMDDISSPGKGRKSDSSPDENRPRKRARPIKPKKPETVHDLTAEEPIQFNGTYHCRLCGHEDTQRAPFHNHIKNHRAISTAYQCMECGECFVVKPSLTKHLLHYHLIADLEKYFQENDCFDIGAVNELAKVVKAPYLANNVKENQCAVCLKQFRNSEEHNKHFRIHGMAFLMKTSV